MTRRSVAVFAVKTDFVVMEALMEMYIALGNLESTGM
jgi:hypothetical protein